MRISILSKRFWSPIPAPTLKKGITFAEHRGASRTTRKGRVGVYANCLVSIDLACSCHHSHHSHFLAAACLHREVEVGVETSLQPANIKESGQVFHHILHARLCKLQVQPHSNAKVQNKLAKFLKKAELSCMCNSAGRSTDPVLRALAFPLDPLPWWAYSWGPCPLG